MNRKASDTQKVRDNDYKKGTDTQTSSANVVASSSSRTLPNGKTISTSNVTGTAIGNADGSTDEKVYTARDRDELREQSPKIVRMIKRYEKIAGDANASVHVGGATAISKSKSTDGSEIDGDAPALMKKQLAKMLEQHADNPQIQEMIRKMIDDLNRQ